MAPKRNVKNNITVPMQPIKRSARIIKRNSQTPVQLKIELPSTTNTETPGKVTKKQRNIVDEGNVVLANEELNYLNNSPKAKLKDEPNSKMANKIKSSRTAVAKRATHIVSGGKRKEITNIKITKRPSVDSIKVTKKPITQKKLADSTQKSEKRSKDKNTNETKRNPRSVIKRKVNLERKKIVRGKKSVAEDLPCEVQECVSTTINLQNNRLEDVVTSCASRKDSRKTSTTSISSWSWTKNLSSSRSSSIIPANDDVIRIDNKLPVLKLIDISDQENNVNNQNVSNITKVEKLSASSVCTNSTKTKNTTDNFDVESYNLNLSSSSLSSCPISNLKVLKNTENKPKNDIEEIFDAFSFLMKKLEVTTHNLSVREKDGDTITKDHLMNILNVLPTERDIITGCRQISNIINDIERKDNVDSDVSRDDLENEILHQNRSDKQALNSKLAEKESFDTIKTKVNENGENYDDEDAISIYAESITGIDSEKLNSSITPLSKDKVDCVYITQQHEPPKKPVSTIKKQTICLNNIANNDHQVIKKSVCEKQSADSTSIYKDNCNINVYGNELDTSSNKSVSDSNNELSRLPETSINTEPCMRNDEGKSFGFVLKNICNYNLFNRCTHYDCRFIHIVPDVLEIRNKLKTLSNEELITEYLAIRKHFAIRRKYGICFVEECCARGMIRVIFELAEDFIVKLKIFRKEDNDHIQEILECILLKLNTVDLTLYADLLMRPVTSSLSLSHAFMQIIGETPNFSRFRPVFISLTNFIVSQGEVFDLSVVGNVLERICILPPDVALSQALLDVLRNTDASIFGNRMMIIFEEKLSCFDKKLYNQLLKLKIEAGVPLVKTPNKTVSCPDSQNLDTSINDNISIQLEPENICLPDTTDVKAGNKKILFDKTLTRTVNFNQTNFNEAGTSHRVDGRPWYYMQNTKNNIKFRQIAPQFHCSPGLAMVRPAMRQLKRKCPVAFKAVLPRYQNKWQLRDT